VAADRRDARAVRTSSQAARACALIVSSSSTRSPPGLRSPTSLPWSVIRLQPPWSAQTIRVERSWDPVKGPIDVKTGAGRRAVPMAFVVRRELMAHKQRSRRDGPDLVFGRTATEAFFASTIRARANKAWKQAGLEPITPHEARHCAISYFIAAGLDWKQIST
jgi:integrase